jgi:uncharacterized integral membrane protein
VERARSLLDGSLLVLVSSIISNHTASKMGKKNMKRKWVVIVVVAIALFLFLVPVIPRAMPQQSNCVFCPIDLGIDYSSISYALFGIGVYHTIQGAIVFGL